MTYRAGEPARGGLRVAAGVDEAPTTVCQNEIRVADRGALFVAGGARDCRCDGRCDVAEGR